MPRLALALGFCWALGASAQPPAEERLKAIFPAADRFTARDLLLSDEQASRLAALARAKVSERMVTFYAATRSEAVLGYAVFHTHRVRTKNETLAVSFEPDGRLKRVEVVAFLEPAEYQPTDRWLKQLDGKSTADRLTVGDDLAAVSGATLSARGIAEQARWLLYAFKEAVR
jgi:hypothetical protein